MKVNEIDDITTEILNLKGQTTQNILKIGENLINAKAILPHGKWKKWLNEKVDFTDRTAQKFMKVYSAFGEKKLTSDFKNIGIEKLYVLVTIPAQDRERFTESMDLENMTVKELKQLVDIRNKRNKTTKEQVTKKSSPINLDKMVNDYEKMKLEIKEKEQEIRRTKEDLLKNQKSNGDMKVEFEKYISQDTLSDLLKYKIYFIKNGGKQLIVDDYCSTWFRNINVNDNWDALIFALNNNRTLVKEEKDFIIGECLKFVPMADEDYKQFLYEENEKTKNKFKFNFNFEDMFDGLRDEINKSNINSSEKDLAMELINLGYKALAKKYHPDVCKDLDATEKFKLLADVKDKLLNIV